MKFLVEIDESVYGQVEVSPEWLDQEINCALDDAFSQYIKVTEIKPGSLLDEATARV